MKLAEALQERADLNRRIEQLRSRILDNCQVQEGEKPLEAPEALFAELERTLSRLQSLIAAINLTNCRTEIDGRTLTECIAEKDVMNVRLSVLRAALSEAGQGTRRARGSEIKILPAVDVAALQKQVDMLSAELRRLDNRLQENNWSTELLEVE